MSSSLTTRKLSVAEMLRSEPITDDGMRAIVAADKLAEGDNISQVGSDRR